MIVSDSDYTKRHAPIRYYLVKLYSFIYLSCLFMRHSTFIRTYGHSYLAVTLRLFLSLLIT